MKNSIFNAVCKTRYLALLVLLIFTCGNVWGQAAVNTVLWGENFAHFGTNTPSTAKTGTGTTIYGSATITYTQSSNNTKGYNEKLAGGTAPELLLAKSNTTWTISGIKTGGAKDMTLSFLSNKTTFSVTVSSANLTVSGSGKSWTISLATGKTDPGTFNITIKNTGSSNARIDNVELKVKTAGSGGSTCATPTSPTNGDISHATTGANGSQAVSWSGGTAKYEIYYHQSSTAPTGSTGASIDNISTTSTTITGRTAGQYWWWVRSDCGSDWVAGSSFTINGIKTGGTIPVNFGTVLQNSVVADKTITVTGVGLSSGTNITASFPGGSPFSVSPSSVNYNANQATLTISASTATAGAYDQNLTLSYGGTYTATVKVTMTVVAEDKFIDVLQNSSGYEEATPHTETGAYSTPTLADKVKSAGTCEGEHYHFVGWITKAKYDAGTAISGSDLQMPTSATGTTYYAVWGDGVPTATYSRLESVASIDGSAQYVLGIDGTGFHYSGTSSWGLTALPSSETPIYYTLAIVSTDDKTFTASTKIGNTTYYLTVPTSNTFTMNTSSETLYLGKGSNNYSDNYGICNSSTKDRHIRRNGASGLRSYAGTTGSQAYFYKVVASDDIDYKAKCCSDAAVVTLSPSSQTVYRDIDGNAAATIGFSQSGGGAGSWGTPTVSPSGPTVTKDGANINFSATATGTYTVGIGYTETCEKTGSTDITVAEQGIISASGTASFSATCGVNSSSSDFTVNSRYLAGSTITASISTTTGSGNFTISTDNSTFNTSNTSITGGTSSKVISHIYVRYEPAADETGSIAGRLTLTQGGTTTYVDLSGTVTCGCSIRFTSDANLVRVTAANGIWVQANSELALSGSFLKTNDDDANVSIRAYTNNAHFQLKTSGTTGEGAAKTSRGDALILETNNSSNTANGWTGSIGIVYKPEAHNTTETATLTVEVYRYGGSTVYATTTYTLYGRSLPENFVIAVNDGTKADGHWYAVPADMVAPWGNSCAGLGTYKPYPITVNNNTNPTSATSAPARAIYTAAARTGAVNTNPQTMSYKSVPLAGIDNYYLYGSSGSSSTIQNAANNTSEQQKWFLDVVDWTNKEYHMHLATSETERVLAYSTAGGSNSVGEYAANASTTKKSVYILPVSATCTYYAAPVVNCYAVDATNYTIQFDCDRTTAYEISTNSGSTWSDLTAEEITTCGEEVAAKQLRATLPWATYRGQTIQIRAKSAGGCQAIGSFTVPNPNVAVNDGTWLSMTGIAGYAFSNTANSVTISGLASCGSQVVGVTCSNGDISASVNQSTGVVTISMTAGNATAGVHTGTLTFTLTGGTTRTQNIQITLTALAVNYITTDGTYFDGNILCGNKGELSSSSVYPFAIAGGLYNSDGTNITLSDFNATDVSFTDLVTGETLTGAIHRALHDATHVKFTVDIQYSQFVQGHTYRLSWTNTGQVMCNSSGVPYQDCYYDFIFSNDCSKPTALEACGISTSSFTANWAGTCTNANSTLNVYTKGAPTNILSNFENTTSNTNNLQYVGASNLAGNYWVMNVDGTSAGVVTTSNTYGLLISDVNNNKYYNLFSPLLSQLIGTVNTNDEYEITLRMATSSAQSGIGVTFYVMSNGSDLAKNTTPSITNKTVTIDGVSGTSKSLAMDGTHTTVTHTFTVKGLAGTDRIRFLGWETAGVASSSKNVYIYDISMSKKGVPSSVSGYPKSVTCSDESYNVSGLSSNTTYFYTLTNNGNTSNEVEVKTRNGNPLISFRDAGANVITSLDMSTEVGIPTSETVEVYATRATICDLEDMITSLTGTNAEYFTVTADFSTWTFYPNLGTYYGDITITYYPTTAGGHTATYSITDNATTSSLTLNGTATGGQIELVHWASTGISVESYVIASGTPRVESYTGVLQSDGTYQISDAGWAVGDQANEVITVVWGATSESFRVPILVASNKNSSTLSSVTSESDIVVGQGHTLTINNTLTCHGLEIYPGAKVQFSGGSLTAKYIRLYNNGDTWSTFAIFDASGASSIAVDNVYSDFRIDEDRYHYITLPFDIMTGNVVYAAPAANGPNPPALRNSANNTAFYVRQYDGRTRETNNLATETTYNVNMPHIGTKGGSYSMTAGRGYMIAIGDQLSATGHKKRTLRFPIAMNSTKWTAEQASSKVVGGAWVADGTDNASARATNKGWNLVGNPFMRELTVTSTSGGLATGVLETPGEDSYIWKINDNGVRYITIYNAATDAFTYQPLNVSFTLKPMAAFYVQMKNAKYINFQAALTGQAAMPAIMRAPLEEEEAVNVMIKLSVADKSDKTGVVLHSKYDAAYNEDDDADYPKLMSGTQVALWSIAGEEQLANNGLPKTSASNIPLGYQAPQTGTYTISLDIDESTLSSLKHVWLTDNDGGTPRDLMLESYTFEVSGTQLRSDRFFLSIELQPKEEILTGTDDAMSESEKPYKFIYQDKLYIMRGGVIYDATGKRVMEINK